MRLIGLTGGIGMGKSTVASWLQQRGERVVDTDLLARQMVEPGHEALAEIRKFFGSEVFAADGSLNRAALAVLVFADSTRREVLEGILHPRIRRAWHAQVEDWRRAGHARGVVVIPLLYETGAEAEFDRVICIACTAPTQALRLRERSWTPEQIAQRNAAQWPVEKKMDRADGVIWNEASVAICEEQCRRLFDLE